MIQQQRCRLCETKAKCRPCETKTKCRPCETKTKGRLCESKTKCRLCESRTKCRLCESKTNAPRLSARRARVIPPPPSDVHTRRHLPCCGVGSARPPNPPPLHRPGQCGTAGEPRLAAAAAAT